MICIGELNKRLVIEDLVATPDGAGGSDVNWVEFATVWAKIKPRYGSEKLLAHAVTSTTTHIISIRYRNGLRPRMRFVDGTREFEIQSIVNVDEANTWLSCLCREKPA